MPEEINNDPLKNLKFLHQALAGDEYYKENVPQDFNEFVKIYSQPENARNLHAALAGDDYYKENIPENFEEAVKLYALPVGKPSPTPPSASGLGTQKNVGQTPMVSQELSMSSPSSAPQYLSPEELGQVEQPPMEEVIQTQVTNKPAPTPKEIEPFKDPKVQDALRLEYLKKKAAESKKVSESYKGNMIGALWNSAAESYSNTVDKALYSVLSVMATVMPEGVDGGEQMTTEERFKEVEKSLKDLGMKETLDDVLKSKGTTKEYAERKKVEGGPIVEGVFGLGESLYPMMTPMQSGFFMTTFADAHKEIREEMPDISPEAQFMYAATQGTVVMLLNEAGLSNLVQNKSVMKNLTGKVVEEIKRMGAKVSPEVLESTTAKIVNGFFAEAETGASEYVAQESIKQIADALEGEKDAFEFEGWQNFISNTLYAGAIEGIGGSVLKSLGEAAGAIRGSESKQKAEQEINQISSMVDDLSNPDVTPQAKEAIKKKVDQKAEEILQAYAEEKAKIEGLSEEKTAEFMAANDAIESANAVLQDPNVSDVTKEAAQQELDNAVKTVDRILSDAKIVVNQNNEDQVEFFSSISEGAEPTAAKKKIKSIAEIVAEQKSKEDVKNRLEDAKKAFKEQREKGLSEALKKDEEAKKALAEVRAKRDSEVNEIAKIRPELTDDDLLLADLPSIIERTIDRMDAGIPSDPIQISEAISELDKKFDFLEAYKKDPKRTHTVSQIEEVIDLLSDTKTELQLYQEQISDYENESKSERRVEPKIAKEVTTTEKAKPTATPKPAKAQVAEIKSKPLTRIEGANMGANQAVGTFVSTEPENRYAAQFPDAEVQQMEVDIENPFVTEDTNLIDYRNEMINRRKGELDETDFTEVEIPSGEFTISDLSDSGIEKVAAMVTEEMKAKGYDSIYFPQVGAQEGELVVFDREKVRRKGEGAPAAEEIQNQKPTQDAAKIGLQQQDDQQKYQGAGGQQQGQQEDRTNQEGDVPQAEGQAGGGNIVAEGGTEQEVVGTYGNEGEVKFADGVILNHKFKLIEADDMQPSHLVSGQRNPKHLIALAQPKERNDQGSRIQQDKIADNPRLQEVGDSPNAYTGAPVVNKRGEVIQGNNRSLGLKKHYDINGTSYKQQLAENAEKFGLTKGQVMAMKKPVLVREVAASDQSAIVLGNYDVKDIETGGKQRIDPIVTSRKIKPSDRQKLTTLVFDGDKTVKEAIRDSAREIATIVKSYINPAQMKTAFSSSGEITASGMDDIEGIMNSFLYEDGPASLPEVFSSLPNVVQKGVQKGIPSLVSVDPEKSLLKDVQNAMTAAYEYIQSGADNFDVWSRSVDMFLGVSPQELFSPLELDLANKMLTAKKQSDIANIFKQYQANVTDQPAGLFDEAVPGLSKKDAIAKQFNLEYNETNDIKGTGADRVAPALRQEGQPNEQAEIGIAAEEEVNVEVEQPETPASEGEGEAVELPTDEQREEIEEDGFEMPTDEEMAAKREEIQTDLQKAIQDVKDRFGDLFNQNMGIIYDPKVEARKLYNFHVSLVNLAKQAIRSGVTTAADFAKLIGKRLDKFTERAFNDAMNDINGLPMIINSEEQMLNAEYQRVAESYAKQREDAKALRKPFLKRFVENANSGWFDVNYVAKKMLADVGGFEAIKFKNLLGGASAKAKMQYENFKREIFGGLNSVEKKLLNDIIQARTIISIDSRYDAKGQPRIKHPGDTNKESQTVFLGLEESANPKQFEKLNKRADKYFDAQRELLDERLKEGRISIEQYQGMIDNDYSPRVFLEYLIDDVESGSGLASGGGKNVGKSDIKSLSDGDVNSLFHNAEWLLATNILSTSRSIFHNRANRSLYELAKADPNNGFIEIQQPNGINKETGQPTYKDPKSDQRQIQFFENGVRKSMLVTREFGESWNNNNPLLSPQYANAIRLASGGVYKRLFATGANPLFALANFPRDIAHALFFTNTYSPTFPIALAQISTDLVRTAKDSWKFNRNKDKNGRYYNYVMQGGGMDFLATQGLPFEQQALIQSSAKDAMDATLKVIGYTNNSSEIWVRLAIRDREINKSTAKFARDNGRMPNESEREIIETNASEVARSQMDFSKGGRWSKAMDNLIPYLNPSLVGLGTSFKYVRENPKIFAYKVAQALAISAAIAAYNMRFKDDYDDIDDEEKNRNMIIMLDFFKTVDGKKRRAYIRIPKNQSSQWIFAMGEIMGETMESKEFRTRKGMSTLQTLMPPYDPRNIPIIDALNTYETGYDRFREKYVYDKDYKGEEWAEYYEGKTPWLWRDLGEQLGLSPVRLKAAVGKYTADPDNNMIWIAVTEAYDKLIKSVPEDEQKAVNDMAIESIEQLLTPVQRKFLGYSNPNSKAKSIRELEEKEATKIKLQNDTVKTFVRKYINDEVTEAEVRSDFNQWLATQPKDSVNVKRLKSRFENSIRFKDLDNVFYRMTETDIPVVKARILYEAYKGLKTDNEREVLLFQAKNAPNVPKDTKSDFWKEFNRLKANGEE